MLKQICWKCGNPISPDEFQGQTRRYCEKCYDEYTEEYKPVISQYVVIKTRVMFERAMRIMERAKADMTKYKRYANAIMKHSRDNPELYRSADEMIAAVVMLAEGYDFEMNHSVGRFRVDMYIPELHVCLEVDGQQHKHNAAQDGKRDVEIRSKLGKEWEVVRIPVKYIEEQPEKLPEAIIAMYNNIRAIRAKNNGILPETYSRREKRYYEQNTLQYTRKTHII